MHLILDMDKTLIWGTSWGRPIEPRPFLQTFLRYCFQNFETVSIWTAAHTAWFETVNHNVFRPILTALNAERESEEPYSFFFVYTDHLTLLREKQSQGEDIFGMNKTDWKETL